MDEDFGRKGATLRAVGYVILVNGFYYSIVNK
jgi:hypothetical protein